MNRYETLAFLAATLLFYMASFGTAYVCGRLVLRYNLKINYTRKINHFVTIGLPWLLQQAFHLEQNFLVACLAAILTPANLLLYIWPIRSRVPAVEVMFRSFDRPEDRPHTLTWLVTQYIAVYSVYLMIYPIMIARGVELWMMIVIAVNVVGDGLAEPVGVAYGKHPYTCTALFTRRRYQRTWEGSACVFLSALIALMMCRHSFTDAQFALAAFCVPISAVAAEAMSPHTWDAPFLFLAIGGELVILSFV